MDTGRLTICRRGAASGFAFFRSPDHHGAKLGRIPSRRVYSIVRKQGMEQSVEHSRLGCVTSPQARALCHTIIVLNGGPRPSCFQQVPPKKVCKIALPKRSIVVTIVKKLRMVFYLLATMELVLISIAWGRLPLH